MIKQFTILLLLKNLILNAFLPTVAIHSKANTKLNLNRILFEWNEITDSSENTTPIAKLDVNDSRSKHIHNILKLESGDTIRTGIVNNEDRCGIICDEASIHWNVDENECKTSIEIALHNAITQIKSKNVSVILALPRPLQLGRILPMLSQMGVDEIILTSATKVPNDYFGSHLLRFENEMRALLLEGLSQAGNDVTLPNVHVFRYLNSFLKYHLDTLFPLEECARVIAHPYGSTRSMKEVVFPNDGNRRIVVAIGPEGGWIDGEVEKFVEEYSFQPISLGDRILRTDVALVSLLALAHDVCDGV